MDTTSDEYLTELENIWNKFCTEHEQQQKVYWANVFLFKYKLYPICKIYNSQFMSSVPSQLSCYLLQLVYDQIESLEKENNAVTSNPLKIENEARTNAEFKPCVTNDITTIASLREFLTKDLGRAILEFLLDLESRYIKLITCKRELASLLHNIFPSSAWQNTQAEIFKPSNSVIRFQEYIDSFNLFQHGTKLSSSNLISAGSYEADCDTSKKSKVYEHFQDDIEYNPDQFVLFTKRHISSDHHAFVIIELLTRLVQSENGQILGEKSVTLESFQFGLDTLNMLHDSVSFAPVNRELLKFKIVSLIFSCLNNLFSVEKNVQLINFRKVSKKLIYLLRASCAKKLFKSDEIVITHYQITSSMLIVYLLFGFLNNIIFLSYDKREEILALAQICNDDEIKGFADDLHSLLSYFSELDFNDLNQIIDLILVIIKEINLKQRVRKHARHCDKNSNQIHCKGRTFACILEGTLLKLCNSFNSRLQCTILKNFEKNSICCCSFTIDIIKMIINRDLKEEIEILVYTLVRKIVWRNLFEKSNCNLCEMTSKSNYFLENLIQSYVEKYESIENKLKLCNFLKHLLRISHNISFEISRHMLSTIILPSINVEINKQDYKSMHLQVILICLKTLINYLNDSKFVKIYFVTEHIKQLNILIYIPELVDAVCTILKIGLNNYRNITNNTTEQTALNKQLIDVLLKANINATNLLNSMVLSCIKGDQTVLKQNILGPFATMKIEKNEILNLLSVDILNISQAVYLTATYWNFILELCSLQNEFTSEFNTYILNTEKHYNQLVQFILNVLSCFLLTPAINNTIQESSSLDSSLTMWNISNYSTIKLTDFCIISSDEIHHSDTYIINAKGKTSIENRACPYNDIGTSSRIAVDRRASLFLGDTDNDSYQSFDEITQSMFSEEYDKEEFLTVLKASDKDLIFDIKNQKRSNEILLPKFFKTEKKYFLSSFNSLIAMIFSSEENKTNNTDIQMNDNNCCNIDFISDEMLKCLKSKAYFKNKLLNIFVSALATLLLDEIHAKNKNMQLLLRQLRNLLLPHSRQRWHDVENADAIIQALHALLKVAEMTNSVAIHDAGKQFISSVACQRYNADKSTLINTMANQDVYEQLDSEVDSENEVDENHIAGDEGYEADAEVLELSDSSYYDKELFSNYDPSSKYRTHLVNEGLCGIVVEIMIELSTQCINDPDFWCNRLTQLASRLYVIRHSLGGSLFLLQGFASVLTNNDSRLKDFQQSILDLITNFNEADALAAYFNILATESPPVELIMNHMANICKNSINVKPSAAISFPMKSEQEKPFSNINSVHDNVKQLRKLHEDRQTESAFTRSACILPLQNVKPWTGEGFTISTWIELSGNSSNSKASNENLSNRNSYEDTHIISFGNNQLVMSVYLSSTYHLIFEFNHPSSDIPPEQNQLHNKENGNNSGLRRKRKFEKILNTRKTLNENKIKNDDGKSVLKQVLHSTRAILNSFSHFHLFLSSNESENILYGARIESDSITLPKNKWTHLCIAVNVEIKNLNLTVIIDGSNSFKFDDLPWNGLQSSAKSKHFEVICIGESNTSDKMPRLKVHDYIEYSLSSIFVFKKCFNNRSTIANLTAFGPDCNHLTYCQATNNIPNYGLLNYNFFWSYDIENLNDALKALRSSLVVSYSAQNPKHFLHYSIGDDLTNMGKREEVISFASDLSSNKIPSIQNATYICGGLSCLLYLFARTVELTTKPEIQANALNILLRVALTDAKLYTEFVNRNFLCLIGSVIKTDRCSKGLHLLKTIVNNACNMPVFLQRNEEIHLIENSNACVIYPNLIVNIVKRYSDWNRLGTTESNVLDMLLQCIQDLVREKQPYQSYNISQFAKIGFVKELLNLCKIYVVESPNPIYLSKESAILFVNLLKIFAGAPPSPSLLDEITKLLLILQKPNECYVTDNRSMFYFLLTPAIPIRQRRIGMPLASKQIGLSLRHRNKSQSIANPSFQNRSESKVSKYDHFIYKKSTKPRPNNSKSFVHDLDTLQSIANCSAINERKLCVVKHENTARFRKFLLNLKKEELHYSQQNKYQRRKIVKKKSKKMSRQDSSIKKTRSNNANKTDADLIATTEYDIVNLDEISSLEDSNRNKKKSFRKFTKPDLYNSAGVIGIQEGLFDLLKDFLLILPDYSIEEVLSHYVKLEILLVLANHRNCNVRTSIVRLLIILCDRLALSELQTFTKKMYWFHLGNQLALHPADDKLVEACIQWVTRKPSFSIHFEELSERHLKIHNTIGLNALIAIAPQTIHSSSLTTNTFKVISHLFNMDTEHSLYMIENGLIQSAIKTLKKIYLEFKPIHDKSECILKSLLTSIAEKSVYSNGQINILWDLLNTLSYYTDRNFSNLISEFRSVQAHILFTMLQTFLRQNAQLGLNIKFKEIYLLGSNLSASETRTRFNLLIDRSVQFFISADNLFQACSVEQKLFELMITLGVSGNVRSSYLIAWGLTPYRISTFKIYVIKTLLSLFEVNSLPSIVCDWKMVKSFLWKNLSFENKSECDDLSKLCKLLDIADSDHWFEESLEKLEMNRRNCLSEQKPSIERAVYKFESIAQSCNDSAMSITRIVADLQNAERKHLMNLMRQYDENLINAEWKLIIQKMTHEGAPWYCSSQYPKSWELDDTEGPSRVRMRLRRCNIDIDLKFIMSDCQEAYLANYCKTQPLGYLIASHDQQINFSFNAQILFNFPAKYIPVDGEIDGELIVTDEKIFFSATHRCKSFYITSFIDSVTEIWIRRYQHQENAFEFFVNSNKSYFYVVENSEDRKVLKEIFSDKIISSLDPIKLMQQWKDGRLTNWEYLMALNQLSGRTYNDLMQYPVFPWILSDYNSNCLDLTQEKSYRKLDKPIAVQHASNEQHYINNYAYIKSSMSNLGTWQMKPYHYSSHYSNSGTVLHFLVRIMPFTNYFLRYQDNNFDIPDRTFHSLNTTWNLASKDSPTDVKELIPEFFCLPEMFENFESFNFGVRQSGELVNHVTLPTWCSNNSRLFILIHRQAFESEMVRKNLHHWIDLIFGYKQTGPASINAINVFHPATYSEFNFADIGDPIEKQAFQTMIKTYGQMPKQLFKTPHDCSNELSYSSHQPSVVTSVKGLRWGIFTGSPQLEEPKIRTVYKHIDNSFSSLVSFGNKNVIYGFSEKTCIMLGTESDYNLVSWHHEDAIVRIQSLNDSMCTSKPLVYDDHVDEISTCGSHFNSNVLWFGHKSGKLTVYHCTNHDTGKHTRNRTTNLGMKLSYNSAFRKISSKVPTRLEEYESLKDNKSCKYDLGTIHWSGPITLIRHTDEVTDICLSTEFKIAVSIAKDGLAVIWDTNSLNYIRTIERPSEIHHSPLNIVKISPTLGDIFTVHSIETDRRESEAEEECFEVTEENLDDFVNVSMNFKGKSIMRLHSLNAKYVNHNVQEDRILSACYSYIKEGTGVNVIATGFEGGIIKLWSSWDLSLIKEIIVSQSDIISVTFSTYQHLVVLTKDEYIQVWESNGLNGEAPKFPQIMYHKGTAC